LWPVGLTAREEGLSTNRPAGISLTRGADLIRPHECSIASPEQELRVHERIKQGVARHAVQAPQPLGLRGRQPESRHLNVFPLNPPDYVVKWLRCCHDVRSVPFEDLRLSVTK
jgi:hypothetical protein